MSRGSYSAGKRNREAAQARKKKEKEYRRSQRRRRGPREIPVTTAEDVTGNLDVIEEAVKRRRAAAAKESRGIPGRLFVGSLAWEATEDDLRALFAPFGPVSDAVIVTDRATGRSRGFGFVVMENHKDAARAIEELNNTELHGRPLVVNVASERQR
jgi:RNA recognition motif-containing protein